MDRSFVLTEQELKELLSYKLTVAALEEAGVEEEFDYNRIGDDFLEYHGCESIDEMIEEMEDNYEEL